MAGLAAYPGVGSEAEAVLVAVGAASVAVAHREAGDDIID